MMNPFAKEGSIASNLVSKGHRWHVCWQGFQRAYLHSKTFST
nr:MAG TPA: hypothetical protein [Bacteriophage sp.]